MNNTMDPEKLKKAPIASSCFMGLGQILYLKQYVRGGLFALVELIMLFCIVWGSTKIIPANRSAADYMREIPETDEMEEYFSDIDDAKVLKKFNSIVSARTKSYKSFAKRHFKSDFDSLNFDEDNQFEIDDNIETLVDDSESDSLYEAFARIDNKYDKKLAILMASCSHEDFDENYDGCLYCKSAHKKGVRTTKHFALFRGPLVTSLAGFITLGSRQNTTVTKYMDHSIFMMINGIFALIIIAFFVFLYILNINSAKASVKKFIKIGHFQTWKEARNDISQNSFATIGIAPSIVMIAIFSVIPLLFSALVAFTNYSSPDHIPPNNLVDWVGLENFVQMFSMKVGGGEWARTFGWTAIWTIVWAIFATFTCFFVGFFYAFVLQDKRVVIPKFFRTVYILPYAIPTMLSLFVWANLLNGTVGPINRTLQLIGLIDQPIPWLSDPWVAKGALIFVNIWIGFPYSMILTTSSMTAIANSLYEAAVIDGATKWQQFKSITYPLVMFQLKPTLIMQFAGNINNFGAVFFLTGGGPNMPQPGLTTVTNCGATDLLISWIYKLTMNTPARYNLASVLSLLVFVVLVPFALYNYTRTKSFKEGEV
jgi:arabinogalactan oligomer/maltooligosaccharide transport system permease protein